MTRTAVASDLALDDAAPSDETARYQQLSEDLAVDGEALHARGLAAAAAGHAETALELLSKAAETTPQKADYFISIGRLLAAETMFNQAALAYLRAQELAPQDPTVLIELADVLEHLTKDEDVLTMLRRIAELLHTPTSRRAEQS
jgi:Flp pilus assembly protein TadD